MATFAFVVGAGRRLGLKVLSFVGSGANAAAGVVPAPPIQAGTTKFLREDSTWAVPAGGGGGAVTSVFGRVGVVVAVNGDYTAAQVGADAAGTAAAAVAVEAGNRIADVDAEEAARIAAVNAEAATRAAADTAETAARASGDTAAIATAEAYSDAALAAHVAAADPHPQYQTNAEVLATAVGGDSSGTIAGMVNTVARGLRETAGPTALSMGAVADGQLLKRVGNTIVGTTILLVSVLGRDFAVEGRGITNTPNAVTVDKL